MSAPTVSRTTRAVAAGALLVLIGGCAQPTLSDRAAADLQARATAVRSAAVERDREGAEAQLERLRESVESYQAQDQLDAGRAEDILAAAAAVSSRLALLEEGTAETEDTSSSPPSTSDDAGSPSPSPSPSPTTEPEPTESASSSPSESPPDSEEPASEDRDSGGRGRGASRDGGDDGASGD